MSQFYDSLETRSPAQRESELMARLPGQIAHAQQRSGAFAAILQGIDAAAITSRQALAQLPVTRKSELLERQTAHRPDQVFGGFNAIHTGRDMPRVFASPGPIYEPESRRADYWRMARALHAAGLRPGELLHNSFAYHFTPAGAMLEGAAQRLGCAVFPAGVGQTELQVQALADLGAHCYAGTPSFLGILIERAQSLGVELPQLRKALVSGEALGKDLLARLDALGISALQCYASADVGLIAYETRARDGLFVDESVRVDIVGPDDQPVPDGEIGEVVVTVLNPDYPLMRFGTGDLSAIIPVSRHTPSPCGRTQVRIRGWLGRADQATKVRGLFVHPQQVHDILRRHPQLQRARLQVSQRNGEDHMELLCASQDVSAELAQAVQQTVRDLTKLRAEVSWHPVESWPPDARTITDLRQPLS